MVSVNEAQMRAQLSRENHRRWTLLQRLKVLERTNGDLKDAISSSFTPDLTQPPLIPRSSSDGANIDWNTVVTNCMELAQSNAQMRSIIAKIIAEKQIIYYRLRHLDNQDFLEIESEIRRIAHDKRLKRRMTNPEMAFQDLIQSSPNPSAGPVWECEKAKDSDVIAQAKLFPIRSITRYLELSAWCDAQRAIHAPSAALDMDPSLDRDLGFSQVSETGFIYTFDEPDLPSNISYQTNEKNYASPIRSGTLVKIVETMTNPKYDTNEELERAFLISLPNLTHPVDVLELIIKRCIIPSAPNVTPSESRLLRSTIISPIQKKCIALLSKWLIEFPEDLVQDKSVSSLLEQHIMDLVATDEWCSCQEEAKLLLDRFKEALKTHQTRSEPPPVGKKLVDTSAPLISSFSQIDDNSFIKCISQDDSDCFRRIQPRELIGQAWMKPSGHAPNIREAIIRFNRMTSFVQTQILHEVSLPKRTAMMARFVHLAEGFHKENNYNAMCAIFAGLNSNAIHRLKQTWDGLPRKTKHVFKTIKALVSTNNNCRDLRNEMRTLKPPCVPHLGMTLKDLTFLDEGNPDRVMYGMINVNKILMMAETVDWIVQCQSLGYTMDTELSPGIREYLEREFVTVDEEILWQLSQKVEPRKTG